MALGTILAATSAAGSLATAADSIFGDDDDSGPNRGTELRRLFRERVNRLRDTDPTESAFFSSGLGRLREQNQRQREDDESTAAARGLTGSQFEIAQQEQRSRNLGRQTRALLGEAEGRLQSRRQSALSGLLRSAGLEEDIRARKTRAESQRKGRLGQIAGSALQAGATIFAGSGGGGGGGG